MPSRDLGPVVTVVVALTVIVAHAIWRHRRQRASETRQERSARVLRRINEQ